MRHLPMNTRMTVILAVALTAFVVGFCTPGLGPEPRHSGSSAKAQVTTGSWTPTGNLRGRERAFGVMNYGSLNKSH